MDDTKDEMGSKRRYWIQRADFSARDYPPVNLLDAEIALRFHNWQLKHNTAYWSFGREQKTDPPH